MKNITELTENEAIEILEFVFPNSYASFEKIIFEPLKDENGNYQVTMGLSLVVGISYRNEYGDGCVLPFHDSKVVLWLYKNRYDILEQLEFNKGFSNMEHFLSNLVYNVYTLSLGEDDFREGYKHNWTLDYVKRKAKEWSDAYYEATDF